MKKTAKFERCVRAVKKTSRGRANPWAVCHKSTGRDPALALYKKEVHGLFTRGGFPPARADLILKKNASIVQKAYKQGEPPSVALERIAHQMDKMLGHARDPAAHGVIDHRTHHEGHYNFGYIVAIDKFMGGWGEASGGKSYYAIAIDDWNGNPNRPEDEAYTVMANLKHRPEMTRVRWVKYIQPSKRMIGNTRMKAHDHLSIADRYSAHRYFEKDAFKPEHPTRRRR